MTEETQNRPFIFMMDLWATVPYYTAYLSRALLREGLNVQVGSISYYLDPLCFSSRGIQTDPGLMDIVGRFHLPRTLRRFLKLAESLINLCALVVRFAIRAPDVLHVQYLPMLKWQIPLDLWFLAFCRKRGSVIVLTVHDLLPHDTASAYKKLFQELYERVDGIICHSNHIRKKLNEEFGIKIEKIKVIPHGPFFYDLPDAGILGTAKKNELMVLWQGIIFPYKGVDLLLKSWSKIEGDISSAYLTIAGTGTPEILALVREQVERLGLKRVTLQLRFISTKELVTLYREADIVVYPYRAITTSGALATGLALGRTLLASDLPVFREILTDGENASLVDPENTDAMAAALLKLLRDPELRERYADGIRAMNFGDASWLSIAKETSAAYQDVMRRTGVV